MHDLCVWIQACGAGGRWERAVLLLHEMEEDGSTPELESYQAVLEILKDAGQWKQASVKGRLKLTFRFYHAGSFLVQTGD